MHTERLDQLDQPLLELNTNVSDLSISLNAYIDDSKKRDLKVNDSQREDRQIKGE